MGNIIARVGHKLFKEKFKYDKSFNLYELIARSSYFDLVESPTNELDNILTASQYDFFLAISQDLNRELYQGTERAPRCNPKTQTPPCKMSKLEDDPHRLQHDCIKFPLLVDDSDGHEYHISLQFEDGTNIPYKKSDIHLGYSQPIGVYRLEQEVPKSFIGQQVLLTIVDRFVDYPQLEPVTYRYTFRLTELSWTQELAPIKQKEPARNK